jgi:hypothetical protein
VPAGQQFVTCTYCHAVSHVAKAKSTSSAVATADAASKKSGGVGVAIAIGSMVAIGVAGYAFLGPGFGSSSLLFSEWYGTACLVDANGDDVLDVAGRVGRPGSSSQQIVVVDGIDGSILWTSEGKYDHEAWVMCFSEESIGVALPNFTVELYSATGGEPKSIKLADAARDYGADEECVPISLADGTTVGLRLPSGERGTCEAALSHRVTGGLITEVHEYTNEMERDGTTYIVEPKKKGTQTLTVRARREGETVWTTPLGYALVERGLAPLAVTPQTIITYGAAPGSSDQGVLIGLDRSDGTPRFEMVQRNRWSGKFLSSLLYNGRHILLGWGFGLHAYDVSTGERVWKIGGRT